MLRKPYLPLLAALLLVIACGGVGGDTSQSGTTPATPTAASTTTGAGCLTTEPALLQNIAAGAQAGTGLKMTGRAKAVRSPDHVNVFLVAAEFTATGVPTQVGVWATNRLDGSGTFMSVDGLAKQFTSWPDAANTGAKISAGAPAVSAARSCLAA